MKDFFISYNRADLAWAEWIAWQLEAEGLSTVIQAWDFRPGSNFVLEMHQAAKDAHRVIAVLSPTYLTSSFTASEWATFFARDPDGVRRLLVPVRVRECQVEGLLGPVVYIDLSGLDGEAARTTLLAGIREERVKPSSPPSFPQNFGHLKPSVKPRFPGIHPAVWNVPHLRNPAFAGREDLLGRLAQAFQADQHGVLPQAITGLGGTGKTQFAVEYLHRHAAEYEVVWWVRANTLASLAADYAGAAIALKLHEAELADQTEVASAVRRWFEGHGGWILVFDDANDPSIVQSFFPRGGAGHVLLTSRRQDWRRLAGTLSMKTFEQSEAIQFLCERLIDIDKLDAEKLARELGNLPLSLAQAAAYIEDTGTSLSTYLSHFNKSSTETLLHGLPVDYPESFATTWEISFQQIETTSPMAAGLLCLVAFFAPEDIPLILLVEGADSLPEPLASTVADPLALRQAVTAARRLSLLEAQSDVLSIHRLVQAAIRNRCSLEDKKLWAAAAVLCLGAAYPFEPDRPETWLHSGRLLPHVLTAVEHAEALRVELDEVARLLNNTALYLRRRTELDQALANLKRVIVLDETIYGPEHPNVALHANNIGQILQQMGNPDEALQYTRRALEISETVYGARDPKVATIAGNLGQLLLEKADLDGALHYAQRALDIDEAFYGPNHPDVGNDVGNIGTILRAKGNLAEALLYMQRAFKIAETVYGSKHPSVATQANNIGAILQEQGDLVGALRYIRRALEIDESIYGTNHPSVARVLGNIGWILQEQGDLVGALHYTRRALEIDELIYGSEHPDVAHRANNIGLILKKQGDLQGAIEATQRSLSIYEGCYGSEHPEVAQVLNNLGAILQDQGDLKGALKYCRRALELWEAVYGTEHPRVAIAANNVGLILRELGDLEGALRYGQRALKLSEAAYGKTHPQVAILAHNVGMIFRDLGNMTEAKRFLLRAVTVLREVYGEENPYTKVAVTTLDNLERQISKSGWRRFLGV